MGANQSSPAANGRTRAYSGSDVPSSTSNGSNGNSRTAAVAMRYQAYGASSQGASGATSAGTQNHGYRTRYSGSSGGGSGTRPQSLHQSGFGNIADSAHESGSSTPEENSAERDRDQEGPRLLIGSLPAHLSPHLFGGMNLAHEPIII